MILNPIVYAPPQVRGDFTTNNTLIMEPINLSTISQNLTVKGMCYGEGYWVVIANNSSNQIYTIYSTSLNGPWTTRLISEDNIEVHGLAYNNGYFWTTANSANSYNNVIIVRITVAQVTGGGWNGYTHRGYRYNDVVAYENNLNFGAGYSTSRACGAVFYISGTTVQETYFSTVTKEFIKVAVYKNAPVAITADGYYGVFDFSNYRHLAKYQSIASNFKTNCVCTMGDYLVTAGVINNEIYIYYTNSNPTASSITWNRKLVVPNSSSSSTITPLALSYNNNQCVLAYKTNSGIYFASAKSVNGNWATMNVSANGLSGYTNGVLSLGESIQSTQYIGFAGNNGSNCKMGNVENMYGLIVS